MGSVKKSINNMDPPSLSFDPVVGKTENVWPLLRASPHFTSSKTFCLQPHLQSWPRTQPPDEAAVQEISQSCKVLLLERPSIQTDISRFLTITHTWKTNKISLSKANIYISKTYVHRYRFKSNKNPTGIKGQCTLFSLSSENIKL